MANELGMNHMTVSAIYMVLQLIISVGFVMLPDTLLAHWAYFFVVFIILCIMYVTFMKKYYHLHEEYLASLKIESPLSESKLD
jgi:cell division protein FtsW (lipid II flippase)